jgi:streptogramin lyase
MAGACLRWLGTIVALVVAFGAPAARAPDSTAVASILAVIPVASGPTAGLAANSTAVWVPSDFDGSLSRLDPLTNRVSANIRVGATQACGGCLGGVALHDDCVWATSSGARLAMVGIDSLNNQVAASVALPVFPSAVMSTADGTLWIASVVDSAIVRIDPLTQGVIASISVLGASHLAAGDDAVWATSRARDSTAGSVVRIDWHTNRVVAQVKLGSQPGAIAFGEGSLWVIDEGRQSLHRVDPRSNAVVATIPVGVRPTGVVAGNGSVWVISHAAPAVNGPALVRIDPIAEAVVGNMPLGRGTPMGLTMGSGSLWVATRDPDTVVRVDPAPPLSSDAGGSPVVLLRVLSLALLLVVWTWRRSGPPSPPTRVQSGGQMGALRRFVQRHPRVRSKE